MLRYLEWKKFVLSIYKFGVCALKWYAFESVAPKHFQASPFRVCH